MTPLEYVKKELKAAKINLKHAEKRKDERSMRDLMERIKVLEALEQLCLDSTNKPLM